MSNNTLTINNAFKSNGISYTITIETPEAQELSKDTQKITELFKAIICSHLGKDNIEDVSPKEIMTTKISYTPDNGAKVDEIKYDNQKIRDVFAKTVKDKDYQGMKVADNPTVANAAEDMYDLITSSSVGGQIDSSMTSGFGTSIGNAIYKFFSNALGYAKDKLKGSNLKEDMKKEKNIQLVQKLCNYLSHKNPKLDDEAKKFYENSILPHLIKKVKNNKGNPNSPIDIAIEFRKFLGSIPEINASGVEAEITKLINKKQQLFTN